MVTQTRHALSLRGRRMISAWRLWSLIVIAEGVCSRGSERISARQASSQHSLYNEEYDTMLKSLAETPAPSVELRKVDGGVLGDLGAKLRELMRLATPYSPSDHLSRSGCTSTARFSDPGGVSPEDRRAAIVQR